MNLPEFTAETSRDLAKLTDALRTSEGGFIGFAMFDTFPTRDALMREVEMRLAGEVEIRRIELTPDQPYLHEHLEQSLQSPILRLRSGQASSLKPAFFVYGFEGISGEARRQAFGALQIKREAIGRMEVPVVLWMAEGNLIDMVRRAPDFFSWRGGLYEFLPPGEERHEGEYSQALARMLDTFSPSLIPPEELRKRLKLYAAMLATRETEDPLNEALLASLHSDIGNIHYQLDEWDAALEHYQQAREIRERLGDTASIADTLNSIGLILRNKGDWDSELAHYQQAREIWERLDDTRSLAIALNNIGRALRRKDRLNMALIYFQQARDIWTQQGDTTGLATALNNIGLIYASRGEWDTALDHYQQAREILERLGDAASVVTTLNNIGLIYASRGEWDTALDHYQQAREVWEHSGDTVSLASTLHNIGTIFYNKGEWDAALEYLRQARKIREHLGDAAGLVSTLWSIGLVYEKQGRFARALPLMERSFEIKQHIGHPNGEKEAEHLTDLRTRLTEVP